MIFTITYKKQTEYSISLWFYIQIWIITLIIHYISWKLKTLLEYLEVLHVNNFTLVMFLTQTVRTHSIQVHFYGIHFILWFCTSFFISVKVEGINTNFPIFSPVCGTVKGYTESTLIVFVYMAWGEITLPCLWAWRSAFPLNAAR